MHTISTERNLGAPGYQDFVNAQKTAHKDGCQGRDRAASRDHIMSSMLGVCPSTTTAMLLIRYQPRGQKKVVCIERTWSVSVPYRGMAGLEALKRNRKVLARWRGGHESAWNTFVSYEQKLSLLLDEIEKGRVPVNSPQK